MALPLTAMQTGWQVLKKWISRIETDPDSINDSDWDTMLKETEQIWIDSGKDELVMDMVCAYLKEIERRYNERVESVAR